MSIRKKRLSPEESRLAALQAARILLIETGPQSVTLKAVAGRIGRTHANLLHHFGSASGLQKALAEFLTQNICQIIEAKVIKTRAEDRDREENSVREIVDMTFDAFDREGAGALASWMLLSGNEDALNPIVETIHAMVDKIAADGHEDHLLHENTLSLCLMALGDALMGGELSAALGLPRDRARAIATQQLVLSMSSAQEQLAKE